MCTACAVSANIFLQLQWLSAPGSPDSNVAKRNVPFCIIKSGKPGNEAITS